MTGPYPAQRLWPLPSRRKAALLDVVFVDAAGAALPMGIDLGFDSAGDVREIFCNGPREGSTMQAFLSDACVVLSLALQHGVSPEALAKSLGTMPAWSPTGVAERPASPIGVLVQALIDNPSLGAATAELK